MITIAVSFVLFLGKSSSTSGLQNPVDKAPQIRLPWLRVPCHRLGSQASPGRWALQETQSHVRESCSMSWLACSYFSNNHSDFMSNFQHFSIFPVQNYILLWVLETHFGNSESWVLDLQRSVTLIPTRQKWKIIGGIWNTGCPNNGWCVSQFSLC